MLSSTFAKLKSQNRCAFVPFITAGDGGLDTSLAIMHTLVENGADIIELGVPFSDPMADGIVIQHAHERTVAQGISLQIVLDLVTKFRQTNKTTPIVLMGYANPIEAFGYQNFAKYAQQAGVNGVLIVDMPPEESTALKTILSQHEIDLIFLVAPTTTPERLKFLANQASGFIYFVAVKGVTGSSDFDSASVKKHLTEIKKIIKLPIGVGFGIKDASTARSVAQLADAAIVGSSIVSKIAQYANKETSKDEMLNNIAQFSNSLNKVLTKE